jgi:hypothetical protein
MKPTTPQILAFVICDSAREGPNGIEVGGIAYRLAFPEFPAYAKQTVYFEVRLCCGVHDVRVDMISEGDPAPVLWGEVPFESVDASESKRGFFRCGVMYPKPGRYIVRLAAAELVIEQEIEICLSRRRNSPGQSGA